MYLCRSTACRGTIGLSFTERSDVPLSSLSRDAFARLIEERPSFPILPTDQLSNFGHANEILKISFASFASYTILCKLCSLILSMTIVSRFSYHLCFVIVVQWKKRRGDSINTKYFYRNQSQICLAQLFKALIVHDHKRKIKFHYFLLSFRQTDFEILSSVSFTLFISSLNYSWQLICMYRYVLICIDNVLERCLSLHLKINFWFTIGGNFPFSKFAS